MQMQKQDTNTFHCFCLTKRKCSLFFPCRWVIFLIQLFFTDSALPLSTDIHQRTNKSLKKKSKKKNKKKNSFNTKFHSWCELLCVRALIRSSKHMHACSSHIGRPNLMHKYTGQSTALSQSKEGKCMKRGEKRELSITHSEWAYVVAAGVGFCQPTLPTYFLVLPTLGHNALV